MKQIHSTLIKPHQNHVAYGYGTCVTTIGEDNKIAGLHVAYDIGRVVNPQSCWS